MQLFRMKGMDLLFVPCNWENFEVCPVCSLPSFFPQQSPNQTFMVIQLTANK